MATLTGQRIKDTYDAVLKLEDNAALTSSPKAITDGLGNNTPISVSTIKVDVSSDLEAASFVKTSGLSTQFLKADGSVDSSAYLTSGDLPASHWSSNLVGIDYAGGNVGIGTTSPNQLLEVASSAGDATINISTDQSAGSQASKKYINLDFSGYNNNVMAKIQSWDESFSGGNGYLTFSTRNASSGLLSQAMVLDYDGNVGIGTNSPSEKLEVSGNVKVDKGSAPGKTAYLSDDGLYIGRLSAYGGGYPSNIIVDPSSPNHLDINSRSRINLKLNNNTVLVANDSGNVGIGTTTPSEKLEVAGDMNLYNPSATSQINFRNIGDANYIKSNGYSTHFGLRGNTGNGVFIIEDSSATTQDIRIKPTTSGWDFSSRGVAGVNALLTIDSVLNISNKTNVGIGTTSPSEKLEVLGYAKASTGFKAGNYTILNESGNETSLGNSAYYPMFFKTNNSVRMAISNAGNVGIGTTSPISKLHVNGDARIGDLRLVSAGGADYIQSDANIRFSPVGTSSGTRMTILSTGNVGIGTTSPSEKLEVSGGNIKGDGLIQVENASNNNIIGKLIINYGSSNNPRLSSVGGTEIDFQTNLVIRSNKGLYSDTSSSTGLIIGSQRANTPIKFLTSPTTHLTYSEAMRIAGDGNVGIGTTTPSYPFVVKRTGSNVVASFEGNENTYLRIARTGTQSGEAQLRVTNNGSFSITSDSNISLKTGGVSGTTRLYVRNNDGNVGIGTTSPSEKLEVTGPIGSTKLTGYKLIFTRNANNEIFTEGASSTLTLGTNSVERMRINSAGNVGIGTSSPSSKLQVSANNGDGITLQHGASNAFYILRSGNDDTIIKQTRNYTSKISISTLADSGTHESSGLNIVGQGVGLKSNIGIGTNSPSQKLEVDGQVLSDGYRLAAMQTAPATRNSAGTLGEIVIDGNYIYVCYAASSWSRVALETSW